MECASCAVASCLRCSSHATRDPRDSLVTSEGNTETVEVPPFLRWPVVSWDGWRGRREEDNQRHKFLNFSADAVASVAI